MNAPLTLSPTLARAIALAILAAICAALLALSHTVFAYHQSLSGSLAFERERLGRLQAHESNRDTLESLEKNVDRITASGLFLEGDDDALKTAKLQEQTSRMLRELGATARSTRAVRAEPIGGFRRLGVEVDLTANLSDVRAFLAGLASLRPKLTITEVRIAAVAPEDAEKRDTVDVQVAVVGTSRDRTPADE